MLAKWQYGLGRVVAWTSDDGSDLAAPWALWDGSTFWAAAVRWALPDPERRPLTVTTHREGTDVVLTVTAAGESGDFADSVPTFATVTSASGKALVSSELTQTAPGEYSLRLPSPAPGAYAVEVRQERSGGPLTEVAGITVPPSPESLPATNGPALLASIAARTGGRVPRWTIRERLERACTWWESATRAPRGLVLPGGFGADSLCLGHRGPDGPWRVVEARDWEIASGMRDKVSGP